MSQPNQIWATTGETYLDQHADFQNGLAAVSVELSELPYILKFHRQGHMVMYSLSGGPTTGLTTLVPSFARPNAIPVGMRPSVEIYCLAPALAGSIRTVVTLQFSPDGFFRMFPTCISALQTGIIAGDPPSIIAVSAQNVCITGLQLDNAQGFYFI